MAEKEEEKENLEEEELYLKRIQTLLTRVWHTEVPSCPTQLLDHLFIGSYRDADDVDQLKTLGITHVLNCAAFRKTEESPYHSDSGVVQYKQFWANDAENYDILSHYSESEAFINAAKLRNGKVLVHCAMGVNRSGAICTAYMICTLQLTLIEVLQLIRQKRGQILCNTGFQRQLIRFARNRQLLGDADEVEKERHMELEVLRTNAKRELKREGLNSALTKLKEKHGKICSNHDSLIKHKTKLSSNFDFRKPIVPNYNENSDDSHMMEVEKQTSLLCENEDLLQFSIEKLTINPIQSNSVQ